MHKEWKLKALTPIWTGDAQRRSDNLIPTGIMGSLRWWYEVLVRGLGGKACDPIVDGVRCPDQNGRHCVVCELFGCTGWARKFRLMVADEDGQVIQNQIKKDDSDDKRNIFILRFISLRPITPEEWCLLDATLRLIACYGAIGGKTVFKPSDEPGRENAFHHRDFGLVQYLRGPDGWQCNKTLEDIRAYVTNSQWREAPHTYQDNQGRTHDFSWASLQNFWFVKGRYLARQDANTSSFNFVIGRPEPKGQSSRGDFWLAGRRPNRRRGIEPASKKVFSFKYPEARTFGFVRDEEELIRIREKLTVLRDGDGNRRQSDPIWQGFDPNNEFLTRERILTQLFLQEDDA